MYGSSRSSAELSGDGPVAATELDEKTRRSWFICSTSTARDGRAIKMSSIWRARWLATGGYERRRPALMLGAAQALRQLRGYVIVGVWPVTRT